MTDYGTLLRDHVTFRCHSIDRIFSSGVRTETSSRWRCMHVSSLAKEVSNSFFSRVWENRRSICEGSLPVRRSSSYSRCALQKGREERGNSASLFGSRGERMQGPGGADWYGPGKGFGMEIVAQKRAGENQPSAPAIRTWIGAGRWPTSITSISISGDSEWGGAFWKTNAYAPFPIWLWLNSHEWAKRQLEKAHIDYEALDNGFRTCKDAVAFAENL